MYKKGAGNDKQVKDTGNRTLCPYRNFSQAIILGTRLRLECTRISFRFLLRLKDSNASRFGESEFKDEDGS